VKRKELMSLAARPVTLAVVAVVVLGACDTRPDPDPTPHSGAPDLTDVATRYAEAWSGQNPEALAAFYADDGTLIVNDGEPSVGRETIAATAGGFMEAFPDMVVAMDSVVGEDGRATFYWTWTGTNTGPGGTGRSVDLSGYEEWTLDAEGRIVESRGHYDEAEYERQISGE
jgi:steroid delta-isomerase-like uncharacterized protein